MTTPRPRHPWPASKPVRDLIDWQNRDFPDKAKWALAYMDLFGGFGSNHAERAYRLSCYGWTPEDLRTVCSAPGRITALYPPETATEAQTEALAALTDEATAFGLLLVAASTHRRQGYAAHLLEEYRWTPEEVLDVVGTDAGGGEPFTAVAKYMRADLLPLILGPGEVTEDLRHALDVRSRPKWMLPNLPDDDSENAGEEDA